MQAVPQVCNVRQQSGSVSCCRLHCRISNSGVCNCRKFMGVPVASGLAGEDSNDAGGGGGAPGHPAAQRQHHPAAAQDPPGAAAGPRNGHSRPKQRQAVQEPPEAAARPKKEPANGLRNGLSQPEARPRPAVLLNPSPPGSEAAPAPAARPLPAATLDAILSRLPHYASHLDRHPM